jgi:hypothetical protein
MSLNTKERASAQGRFLMCYEESGQVMKAARWAKMPSSVHYRWLDEDPTYRLSYQAIAIKAAQRLEDEAVQARDRVRKLVPYECQPVRIESQLEQEDSGRLLEKLLGAAEPNRFNRRSVVPLPGKLENLTKGQTRDLIKWLSVITPVAERLQGQKPS